MNENKRCLVDLTTSSAKVLIILSSLDFVSDSDVDGALVDMPGGTESVRSMSELTLDKL